MLKGNQGGHHVPVDLITLDDQPFLVLNTIFNEIGRMESHFLDKRNL